MTESKTHVHRYSGSRAKKEARLGQAHLAPGMNEARLLEIYKKYGITTLADLDAVDDKIIEEMVSEIAEIVEREKGNG